MQLECNGKCISHRICNAKAHKIDICYCVYDDNEDADDDDYNDDNHGNHDDADDHNGDNDDQS